MTDMSLVVCYKVMWALSYVTYRMMTTETINDNNNLLFPLFKINLKFWQKSEFLNCPITDMIIAAFTLPLPLTDYQLPLHLDWGVEIGILWVLCLVWSSKLVLDWRSKKYASLEFTSNHHKILYSYSNRVS